MGVDVEVAKNIAKKLGVKANIVEGKWDGLLTGLSTGTYDLVINGVDITKERENKFDFSTPYAYDHTVLVVRNDNTTITSFDDLKGKTVGCTNGQAAQTIIEDMAKEKGFTVKLYEDSAVGMNDLKLGRIDAYANTTTNVNAFTHNNTDAKFRFFDEQLLANNVAYFLQKTDDGDKLTKELDDVIQDMLDDGTVAKITEKWMYADMTKLIQK